ncbi:MAG TPA: response regulator transcription factor [Pyrinomonadaceae bacterium]
MRNKTRILIADDHPIFRSGLRNIIEAEAAYEVVAEADDGETALRLIEELSPDIAILDVNMPEMSGFDVISKAGARKERLEFVILTMHDDKTMFRKAMDLGVRGYVLKDSASVDIVNCLHAVCKGQYYTSAAVTSYLFKRVSGGQEAEGLDSLTPTERTVLKKVAEYKTSREIADELNVSVRTIENHRANISSKVGLQGSHALMKFALKHEADI